MKLLRRKPTANGELETPRVAGGKVASTPRKRFLSAFRRKKGGAGKNVDARQFDDSDVPAEGAAPAEDRRDDDDVHAERRDGVDSPKETQQQQQQQQENQAANDPPVTNEHSDEREGTVEGNEMKDVPLDSGAVMEDLESFEKENKDKITGRSRSDSSKVRINYSAERKSAPAEPSPKSSDDDDDDGRNDDADVEEVRKNVDPVGTQGDEPEKPLPADGSGALRADASATDKEDSRNDKKDAPEKETNDPGNDRSGRTMEGSSSTDELTRTRSAISDTQFTQVDAGTPVGLSTGKGYFFCGCI